MGTVCGLILAQKGFIVTIWSAFEKQAKEIAAAGENTLFLPGYPFPKNLQITHHAEQALADTGLIVAAVPCQFIRGVFDRISEHLPDGVLTVSVAKGVENDTLLLPTQIIGTLASPRPLVCLSGPSIAPEVARGLPAAVVAAAEEESHARVVQDALSTEFFRVYTNTDLIGVELAAASKNVIALAAGIADGLQVGDNAKAALVTRGLVEITRLGLAFGARAETFGGLAGVGDLITTCISPVGRNRSAGEKIGQGMAVDNVISSTPSVIEGIATTRSISAMAGQKGVEMPIVQAVYSVLHEGLQPGKAIHQLMTRQLKSE